MTVPTSVDQFRDQRAAELDAAAPVMSWPDFIAWLRRNWRQGNHMGIIGPTGQGKTTFALSILELRKYVVAFGTKKKDETLERFAQEQGYRRYQRWNTTDSAHLHPHRLLWPDANHLYRSVITQRREFRGAFVSMYDQGNWTVYIDELWYIIHHLKLELEIRLYLLQARSDGISLVVATQRPAFVPLEVYDQSTILVFFRDNDETNLKRISGISWLSKRMVQSLVAKLPEFQALVINTRTGEMLRTTAPEKL